jgi:hypothetical protein
MPRRPDPAALRAHALTLRAGAVLRRYDHVAEKTKRLVLIAASAERSLAFFINTQPSPFICAQPELLRRQVQMPRSLHPFMQHDSHIACHDTVSIGTIGQLAAGLCDGSVERLGTVHESLHELIGIAAAGSKLIAQRDHELIVQAFPRQRDVFDP